MEIFFKKLEDGLSFEEAYNYFKNYCLKKKLTLGNTKISDDEIKKELYEVTKLYKIERILSKL